MKCFSDARVAERLEPLGGKSFPLRVAMHDARQTDVVSPMTAELLDEACRVIAVGRLAARQLATAVQAFGLSEAEFRVLWALSTVSSQQSACHDLAQPRPPNQTELGMCLGLSASQVSAVVERLRGRDLILGTHSQDDRRRQEWELTVAGDELLRKCAAKMKLDFLPWTTNRAPDATSNGEMEVAA